jgi:hypothetical protein
VERGAAMSLMALFDRSRRLSSERSTPPQPGLPVDLARFDRLVHKSVRLREVGVTYEAVQRRALRDAVSFNEALETLYQERFDG